LASATPSFYLSEQQGADTLEPGQTRHENAFSVDSGIFHTRVRQCT
jgi:hypothetical protein